MLNVILQLLVLKIHNKSVSSEHIDLMVDFLDCEDPMSTLAATATNISEMIYPERLGNI